MIAILKNALVFDGVSEELIEDASVVIEGDRIREVSPRERRRCETRTSSIAAVASSCPD